MQPVLDRRAEGDLPVAGGHEGEVVVVLHRLDIDVGERLQFLDGQGAVAVRVQTLAREGRVAVVEAPGVADRRQLSVGVEHHVRLGVDETRAGEPPPDLSRPTAGRREAGEKEVAFFWGPRVGIAVPVAGVASKRMRRPCIVRNSGATMTPAGALRSRTPPRRCARPGRTSLPCSRRRPDLRRQVTAVRIDDVDAGSGQFLVRQHRLEPAGLDVAAHHGPGNAAIAEPGENAIRTAVGELTSTRPLT